jgi:RDD family
MKIILRFICAFFLLYIGLFAAQGASAEKPGPLTWQMFHLMPVIDHLVAARIFNDFSNSDVLPAAKIKHRHSDGNDVVVTGGSYKLAREDAADNNVIVIGGEADIKGTINGDLVMIGSRATFSGTVNGDLVAVGSNLQVESGATANGDLVSFAAEISHPELLQVNGEHVTINTLAPMIPFFKETFSNLTHLRPMSPFSFVSWSIAILILLGRLLIAWIFPKTFPPADLVLRERPVPAFLVGLAIISGATILSFLLLITFVGIVALPFIALAIFLLDLFGETCVSYWIGKRILPQLAERPDAVYAWIVCGTAVIWLLYCIPVIGFIATSINLVLGIGTASICLFEHYRSQNQLELADNTMKSQREPTVHPPPLSLPPGSATPVVNLSKAQFFPRLAANLIDLVILYVLLVSLHLTRGLIPMWVLYRFAMFAWRSATMGEIVLNLRVQKEDGTLLTGDYSSSLIRALSSLISLLPLGLGFIWILFNRNLDSWHDKISGSYVVQVVEVTERGFHHRDTP